MLFLSVAVVCIAVLGTHQVYFLGVVQRRRSADFEGMLASVEAVNLEGIRSVADLFLSPTKNQLGIEPPVMWEMLGGLEGVTRMRTNAKAMLDLCIYAERWGQEGELVAHLVRTDALYLSKAVRRIEWYVWFGVGRKRSHFALLEAAGYYDLIQRRLLGLYESIHVGRLPALQESLGFTSAA